LFFSRHLFAPDIRENLQKKFRAFFSRHFFAPDICEYLKKNFYAFSTPFFACDFRVNLKKFSARFLKSIFLLSTLL